MITLILNFSISFLGKSDSEGRIQCLSALSETFKIENEPQNYLRLVTAYGNLMNGDNEAAELGKALGVSINTKLFEGADEKTSSKIKDIAKELNLT